ncbi:MULTISPECIES: type VII secretion protein EccB [unclassified Streptomyces]|uniref:type VII secretion protein EccB n=1 Tax=unclassified Streptomyces TaxID=2593676 RepID=UPI0023662A33|nr:MULTISPECIES: type VII secretion protein EccB [unclassified Streptomyces]MDF3147334.1 type VII secretion protein EccB [Streptomyces sp. T21Q-yed]WDF41688.1 type VII secretion protein EccB [Streptomyces sp. T12]
MAKRRDELAAYTFARKRTVAAFLAPSPGGSEEGAPRPIRTVMPSLGVGLVLVIGFIAWGVIKPTAPKGWDTPGEYIIVDSDSTTRYVVLNDKTSNGKKTKTLHPVLNYASAKLLLDKGKGSVIEVPGKEIDKSAIPHGATLGIPYAPDRLPSKEDAEKAKTWAVCERPVEGAARAIDRAVFVLNATDAKELNNAGKVGPREVLYVRDTRTKLDYLVDSKGNKFLLGGPSLETTTMEKLRAAAIGTTAAGSEPQLVSSEWLSTLNDAGVITFPTVPAAGGPTQVQGLPADTKVGRVIKAQDAQIAQYYVVLQDKVAAITPFVAGLIRAAWGMDESADIKLSTSQIIDANGGDASRFYTDKGWPETVPRQANSPATATAEARTTSCSVYNGTIGEGNKPQLAAWAGTTYPKRIVADSLSAYVSSGSGLLFTEVTGAAEGGGAQYLLTDTGLRYSLPKSNDSAAKGNSNGSSSGSSNGDASETDKARTRLGYEDVSQPSFVPQTWATFIPKGPTLDTGSAAQEQSQ